MPFDASISGAGSNSFAAVEEADDYFSLRLYSTAWDVATPTKQAALVTASRRISEELFGGDRATTTQALAWPRINAEDVDGNPIPPDIIPARVKEATFITALEILKTDFLQENYLANYSYLQTGVTSFKQFQPGTSGKLPEAAKRLLKGLLLGYGPTVRIVRG